MKSVDCVSVRAVVCGGERRVGRGGRRFCDIFFLGGFL